MIKKFFLDRYKKEVSWWKYAGWTIPFVALAILFFLNLFGWTNVYDKMIIIIGVTFFSVSVFWWWWALDRIYGFIKIIQETTEKFENIKDELTHIKSELRYERENTGNR